MLRQRALKSAAALLVWASYGVYAASPLSQNNMSLDLANALVESAMKTCHAEGRSAVVVVTDRGGNVLALQRDDNVGPHNTDAARKKAFTALSTKTPTRQLAEKVRNDPESANLATLSDLLIIGGGVPVKIGNDVIGALGVGGSGGAASDDQCAAQAIKQVLPAAQ